MVNLKYMTTDPIAEMLTIIRNGYLASLTSVACDKSKIKVEVAKILTELGYIGAQTVKDKTMNIKLVYDGKKAAMTKIKRISRPGLRVYQNVSKLRQTKSRLSTKILSTPQGIMTDRQAIAKKTGGEVIAIVY